MLRSKPRRTSSAASRAFHRRQRSSSVRNTEGESPVVADISKESAIADKLVNETSAQISSNDEDVDKLASTMSALKFVPPSVRFGRGGRAGLGRK